MKHVAFAAFLAVLSLGAAETTVENTNFTLSLPIDGKRELYNYDRLRLTSHVSTGEWFATAIGDVENHLGRSMVRSPLYVQGVLSKPDVPFSTCTDRVDYGEGEAFAQIHRLYGGYADGTHRLSIGLQKITFGVGRIWNPTDLFNPKNPFALEPDEMAGSFSAAYTYALGDLSQITALVAQRRDHSFKYAARVKGNRGGVDAALSGVASDERTMVGYEIESELSPSGIGIRSEGGWFEDKTLQTRYFQGIVGADYGFANSLIVAAEWLYTSQTLSAPQTGASFWGNVLPRSHHYGALSASYLFEPLLGGSMALIVNAEDGSFYAAPSLRYSWADDVTLGCGAMVFGGSGRSEFGSRDATYWVNVKMTF